jgi:DNA-binding Lrp family transcriptional regulator
MKIMQRGCRVELGAKDALMLDDLDRSLIHALHIDGRAAFSRIGAILGVSTQTVVRRYRRLSDAASLRVVGLADPQQAGKSQWLARLTASPHVAQDLAHALARRSDTSWVKLASGGTEICAIVCTDNSDASGPAFLLHDLPRTASITAVSAHYLLHTYLGGPTAWSGRVMALSEKQRRELEPPGRSGRQVAGPLLADTDQDLLAALWRDGRASHAELAAATGWSPAAVARRLTELRASGALFFDIEINDAMLGVTTQALLWMTVMPARLDEVAAAMARHDELAFVAATTGPTNLVAHALCADPGDLHDYLIRRLGALHAIRAIETAPVLRTVKATARPSFPP